MSGYVLYLTFILNGVTKILPAPGQFETLLLCREAGERHEARIMALAEIQNIDAAEVIPECRLVKT